MLSECGRPITAERRRLISKQRGRQQSALLRLGADPIRVTAKRFMIQAHK